MGMRRRRTPYYPTWDDPRLRALEVLYHEVNCRVRDDNPRDVVLMKVQREQWIRNLTRVRGKVAARRYPAVRQFDRLIKEWYDQHPPR